MESATRDVWAAIEERLGFSVSPKARQYSQEKYATYLTSPDPLRREKAVQAIEKELRRLKDYGAHFDDEEASKRAPRRQCKALKSAVASDGRWHLWSQLVETIRATATTHEPEVWEPLKLTHVLDLSARPLLTRRVEISFDSRYSLKALKDALTKLWPDLEDQGWVEGRRPLLARKLDLVRFVCLQTMPGWTWQRRFNVWNEQHPKQKYRTRQAFLSAFRKAEEALTGHKYGLAWFYDAEARSLDLGSVRRLNSVAFFRWLQEDKKPERMQIREALLWADREVEFEMAGIEVVRDFYDQIHERRQEVIDGWSPMPDEEPSNVEYLIADAMEELFNEVREEGVDLEASYEIPERRGENQGYGYVSIGRVRPDPDLGERRVEQ